MDTQKMITAIFLICIAVGAVGAVAYIVIDGTSAPEEEDFSDCVTNTIKKTYTVGDFYTRTTTNADGSKSVVTWTIEEIDKANKRIKFEVDTDGLKTTVQRANTDLMHLFTMDYIYAKYPTVGPAEKIDTVYGKVKCAVHKGIDPADGLEKTYYVGPNGVCYLFTINAPTTPDKVKSTALTDTSLFNERPGQLPDDPSLPADPSKTVKKKIEAGDFIELSLPNGPNATISDRYTVKSVDAETGNLTVTNVRGKVSSTVVMTTEDFLDMIVPVLGGAIKVNQPTPTVMDTVWGKITMDVYYIEVPAGDKKIIRNLFVDPNGILFKVTESGEDIKDGSGAVVDWKKSVWLKDTNMLEGYVKVGS